MVNKEIVFCTYSAKFNSDITKNWKECGQQGLLNIADRRVICVFTLGNSLSFCVKWNIHTPYNPQISHFLLIESKIENNFQFWSIKMKVNEQMTLNFSTNSLWKIFLYPWVFVECLTQFGYIYVCLNDTFF